MKVILLCAGYATRLYPLTKDRPKPLLPVGGKPMIEWILDCIKGVPEIDGIYIVTNHCFAGHFEKWKNQYTDFNNICIVDDGTSSNEDRLGAIGDLQFVLKNAEIGKEDLLVLAGDNLFDFNIPAFIKEGNLRRPHAAVAAYDVKDKELAKQYGLLKVNSRGNVEEFLEKPQNPPTTLSSCGIYWLPRETRDFIDRYLAGGNNADQPGHYMRWLAQEESLDAILVSGLWFDIGDLNSYKHADEMMQKSRILK